MPSSLRPFVPSSLRPFVPSSLRPFVPSSLALFTLLTATVASVLPCQAQSDIRDHTMWQPSTAPDAVPPTFTEVVSAKEAKERIAWANKMLSFANPDGKTIGKADIIFTVEQIKSYRDSLIKSLTKPVNSVSKTPGQITTNAVINANYQSSTGPGRKWGYYVPYQFVTSGPNAVSFVNQNYFLKAAKQWERVCWVKFVPRTNESDYVLVYDESRNQNFSFAGTSYLGRNGGTQEYHVKNWNIPSVPLHELGHTLGFYHEHQRPDRDSFISVNYNNIDSQFTASDMAANWGVLPSSSSYLTLTGYDYSSVMHYGREAVSPPYSGLNVISALNPYYNDFIRDSSFLSYGDMTGATFPSYQPYITYFWRQDSANVSHQSGRADQGGWSASPQYDPPNSYLMYGPYTNLVDVGEQVARFQVAIGSAGSTTAPVCRLDVYDATSNTVLSSKEISSSDYPYGTTDGVTLRAFDLPLVVPPDAEDDLIEFRVFWYGSTYVRVQNVGIRRPSWKATDLNHQPNTVQQSSTPGTLFSYPGVQVAGYALYGPYTTSLTVGDSNSGGMKHTASFSLATSPENTEPDPVATLEVYNATRNVILASRMLNKSDIKVPSTTDFVEYNVNFKLEPYMNGDAIEFRVYWHGTVPIRYKSVSVMSGWWK